MTKLQLSSRNKTAKAIGVGLVAGGLLLVAPAGIALADTGPLNGLGSALSGEAGFVGSGLTGEAGFGQNRVNHTIGGLQGIAAIDGTGLKYDVNGLNSGLQSGSTATSSLLNSGGNLTTFAVQGLLRPGH
ncbi:hypothetical protein FZI85_07965 [Mycobacterium sp. CBMA293]|uniref:hypothetical protein n=1 Tax=unclassified Mycolicibacterium TaxID=2636767 RepID=UPI0012DFE5D0|nr:MULTISPECIES: hypothetical protein [unclassified Mycolicibacterium]MUL46467.1 hypothetical protein [Mycolicibacterium sp. CBMA 360]MUL57021.1 hypothetical protein [Mycolicibacterium sp. CBMA 335]MUL70061.1 hypothetical protein [Mycolicibacterium sp. CBMA 311]MUL92109.1 hypothetical protein [Mycolicibacterium sp. CBMA 230]MUM05847.1 hypothetical protein [Mycolicibacterium sp. CBMA 213]